MGKSTISIAIFHYYVSSPEGTFKYTELVIHTTSQPSRPRPPRI